MLASLNASQLRLLEECLWGTQQMDRRGTELTMRPRVKSVPGFVTIPPFECGDPERFQQPGSASE
jgi:hypothetical protein